MSMYRYLLPVALCQIDVGLTFVHLTVFIILQTAVADVRL